MMGMPRPLDLALFMREFEHEVAAPVAPALARTVMAPLAAIGERRGLAARYRRSRPVPAVPLSARPVPIRPGAGRASATRPSPARPAPSRPGGPGASAPRRTAGRRG